jgi:hypothetical protein
VYSPLGPPLPPDPLWCEYVQSGAGTGVVFFGGVELDDVVELDEPDVDPLDELVLPCPAVCAPSVDPERSTVASFPPQAQRAKASEGTATKERRTEDFMARDGSKLRATRRVSKSGGGTLRDVPQRVPIIAGASRRTAHRPL